MSRETIFSPCRKYRYTLWREWGDSLPLSLDPTPPESRPENRYAMFIGLNPLTADETLDDPTIRRCIGYAKAWGYGALCMTNLFAWRDTLPANMKRCKNPVGDQNQKLLCRSAVDAGIVIAAWGKDGRHLDQDFTIRQALAELGVELHHLGLNGDGTPKHPLYLKKTVKPTEWKYVN